MPVLNPTQKDLLLESIPKMHHEIRIEMISLIERKGCTNKIAQNIVDKNESMDQPGYNISLSEQEKARLAILRTLKNDLNHISDTINADNSDDEALGTKYRAELKTKIEAALLNPDVTKKYGCFKKLAILLLNIVTGVTVVPALIKKVTTGSFLYSFHGKSKEAVDKTHNLLNKLNKESKKLTKKKNKPGK